MERAMNSTSITDRELREKTGNPFLFGEPFYQ